MESKPFFVKCLTNGNIIPLTSGNRFYFEKIVPLREDFIFLDGALEALKRFSQIFNRIIIVTNQQGIKKGIMTEQELISLHEYMISIIVNNGGKIDKIYYCTDLAISHSLYRKPNIGMALKAKKDFPEINFKKSIMVGDSISDMQFGKKLNMLTVFISDSAELPRKYPKLIDYSFRSLYDFSLLFK